MAKQTKTSQSRPFDEVTELLARAEQDHQEITESMNAFINFIQGKYEDLEEEYKKASGDFTKNRTAERAEILAARQHMEFIALNVHCLKDLMSKTVRQLPFEPYVFSEFIRIIPALQPEELPWFEETTY